MGTNLTGAWRLQKGFAINNENIKTEYDSTNMVSTKILSEKHFCFVSHLNNEFYAAASGEYQIEGDKYSEKVINASWTSSKGDEYLFFCKVDGNIWINTKYDDNNNIVEYEEWVRISK